MISPRRTRNETIQQRVLEHNKYLAAQNKKVMEMLQTSQGGSAVEGLVDVEEMKRT